jgi:hypothetical protein
MDLFYLELELGRRHPELDASVIGEVAEPAAVERVFLFTSLSCHSRRRVRARADDGAEPAGGALQQRGGHVARSGCSAAAWQWQVRAGEHGQGGQAVERHGRVEAVRVAADPDGA